MFLTWKKPRFESWNGPCSGLKETCGQNGTWRQLMLVNGLQEINLSWNWAKIGAWKTALRAHSGVRRFFMKVKSGSVAVGPDLSVCAQAWFNHLSRSVEWPDCDEKSDIPIKTLCWLEGTLLGVCENNLIGDMVKLVQRSGMLETNGPRGYEQLVMGREKGTHDFCVLTAISHYIPWNMMQLNFRWWIT